MDDVTYNVRIVMRDGGGQTSDDYHATVTRSSDGAELVWISWSKRLLKWKTRRKAIVRAFIAYDKRQAKLTEVEHTQR